MPLVTLTLHPGKSRAHKTAILGAVHGAPAASGVPVKDRFHRVLALGPDDIRFDPQHVLVVFKETAWENRAFGGGRLIPA